MSLKSIIHSNYLNHLPIHKGTQIMYTVLVKTLAEFMASNPPMSIYSHSFHVMEFLKHLASSYNNFDIKSFAKNILVIWLYI